MYRFPLALVTSLYLVIISAVSAKTICEKLLPGQASIADDPPAFVNSSTHNPSEELTTAQCTTSLNVQRDTDHLLFHTSMPGFIHAKLSLYHRHDIDWSDDDCTHVSDKPVGFNFHASCARHDFGYRNYGHQCRCTERNRHRIDLNFARDMCRVCGTHRRIPREVCWGAATKYYEAVYKLAAGHCRNGYILMMAEFPGKRAVGI